MKSIILLLFLLLLLFLTGCSQEINENITNFSNIKTIVSTCPFGEINCEYPGNCGRYNDINKNDICDHSE